MRPFRAAALASTLLGAAAACGLNGADSAAKPAPAAAPPAAERLTVELGCDETFVAKDPAGTAVLAVTVPGLLDRARGAELPASETIAVGGPGIEVRLEQGADLDHWCTDVMARPPRIDAAWTGVTGTATVTLVARRGDHPPTGGGGRPPPTAAVVRLVSVVVAREGSRGERLELPDLEIAATLGVPGGG
jgi:hypothetical protein